MTASKECLTVFFLISLILLLTWVSPVHGQVCIDGDGDGFGLNGDASCPNAGVDCNDGDAKVYPNAPRICDAKDNDCDGFQDFFTDRDADGDGSTLCAHWQTGLKDCNDSNPNMYPDNIEGPFGDPTCSDGLDNDCDFKKDAADNGCSVNCIDTDVDGYGSPGNITCPNGSALDCNNNNANINPGASDANCNGVDENCSGTADDEYVITVTNCGVGECASTGQLTCNGGVEADNCTPGSPVKEGPLGDASCTDTLDNDCDGGTDGSDIGCQSTCLDDDGDGYGFYGDASCPNAGVDCDDDNNLINPGAADTNCDNVDDNCSGTADDEYVAPTTNCGVGECATTGLLNCVAGATVDNCIPLPAGTEGPFGDPSCIDGLDNDCDGKIDLIGPDLDCNPLDQDNDGDNFCEGPSCIDGSSPGDCDDTDPVTYPGAPRICDGKDNDCDTFQDFFTDKDVDGDGVPLCVHYQTGLQDCDDNNPNRYPGNVEGPFGDPTCEDSIDNDCDFKIDLADNQCQNICADSDGDGYGNPGHSSCPNGTASDCNDNSAAINPGAPDGNCNGVDENCSGTADDEYIPTGTNCGVGECASTGTLNCSGGVEEDSCTPGAPVPEGPLGDATCGDTLDNDCDGTTDGSDPGCQSACLDSDGDGYGLFGDASCPNTGVDCNDSNAAINPGAPDAICDNVDDNCSGTPDDQYIPAGTNCGTGECSNTGQLTCINGAEVDDCTPLVEGIEGPPGDLTCSDGLDNDCDVLIDSADDDCNSLGVDDDGDGFCEGPSCTDGSIPGDCDDEDPQVNPGADPSICDGKDTDCDGFQDFFSDVDGDGDGVPLCGGDCNDSDPNRYPGNQEGPRDDSTCFDGIDNDCDSKIDAADAQCAPPTCTIKINPKDGPHMFNLLDSGNNVLKTACLWCHFNDSATTDQRRECQRCHADPADGSDPLNGVLKLQYPLIPPYGFGTAQNVKLHSSSVVGTKYGSWDMHCLTCHNPHLQEQDFTYGTSYGKYVKEYICFDNPVTGLNIEEVIEFTAAIGPGSFADGAPHNENVCEMCHTQTKYHRNDGSTATHNDSSKCTDCHLHTDGFLPVAKSPHNTSFFNNNCQLCHVETGGVLDLIATIPDANCRRCHGERTSHTSDLTRNPFATGNYVYDFACVDCHNPMSAIGNNRKLLRETIAASIIPGSFVSNTTRIGPGSLADGLPRNENICETCHSLTSHNRGDGTGDGVHADSINYDGSYCMLCHDHNRSFMIPGPSAEE